MKIKETQIEILRQYYER